MQLGRYQVLKQLASGGVADVLLARASGLEGFARHVVIKRMKPELAKEERFAKAFLDEARIAASLHHQNIVQVHDIGEEGDAYYFAMEYIHGEDARTLLAKVRERNEHVPLEIAVAIAMSTAAGLHHAHEKTNSQGEKLDIVHRDVSPSNILVGYDGSVKIVDFGLAKAAQRSTQTAAGTLKGKASYMSPEQCRGEPIDRRTDTFCLGIVLYELVTAERLFKGPTEFATMAAVVNKDIAPPSRVRSDIPLALDAIILRALAREPSDRYQTAEDFRAAVEAFAVEYQLRTSNKALADYVTRLFGQREEPWHVDVDVKPVTDDTLDLGLHGIADKAADKARATTAADKGRATTAADKGRATTAAGADDADDDDSFSDDEIKTTLMRDDSKLAAEAQARIDAAKARAAGRPAPLYRATTENELVAATVVEPAAAFDEPAAAFEEPPAFEEPAAFETETDTIVDTDLPEDPSHLKTMPGKKAVNRNTVPSGRLAGERSASRSPPPPADTAPGARHSMPGPTPSVPAGARGNKTPPGSYPNATAEDTAPDAVARSGASDLPTGALPQGRHVGSASVDNPPPGALPQGRPIAGASTGTTPPGAQAVLDGGDPMHTVLGVGAAGPGPSVFSQYGGEPLPEDFSLSKFADFKRWFAMYRSSILFGGAAGIAAVIILVIVMRACGSAPGPAARSDVPPPDAAEVKRVDAAEAPPARDADPHVHTKQASGSAAH